MTLDELRATSRRRFLQYLAASPLVASTTWPANAEEASLKLPDPMIWAPQGLEPIKSPKDAINVFDFEPAAFKNVPPAHFGYMASGIDDEVTLRANREGFSKFQLRPRRLNDVSKVDMSVEIFGGKYDSPIFISPTGGNMFFNPDGEVAVARAARSGNHLQILSTSANYSIEDVTKARGAPVWFQLYASPSFAARAARRHNYDGIDLTGIKGSGESNNLTWDTIKRMRDVTKMKIVLKGIVTSEDAELSVQNGIDGILLSNHGGRGEDNGRSTIDALPEIVAAVNGKIPVFIDGGFRRGTDVVKALALGAKAAGVGRPYLWGLGAFGEEGVARVLELMRVETRAAMQQCGVKAISELNPNFVRRAS